MQVYEDGYFFSLCFLCLKQSSHLQNLFADKTEGLPLQPVAVFAQKGNVNYVSPPLYFQVDPLFLQLPF